MASLNRHAGAEAERPYDLVALADPRPEAREALAAKAEEALGRRPAVYDDYR